MYKYKNLFLGLQIYSYINSFGMKISGKGIENLFVNNMVLKFLFQKKTKLWKKTFPCIFAWESIKMIPIWNCRNDDFPRKNILMELKIVPPKQVFDESSQTSHI
jgi:hypothetical protein